MSTLTPTRAAAPTRTPRDARRARRLTAAILLPIAPLSVAALRMIWPQVSASGTAESLDAVAAHPAAQEDRDLAHLVMTLTIVTAVLAAARLARRRRPVLAMLTAGVNLVAYLAGATALIAPDLLTLVAVRGERDRAVIVPYLDAVNAHPTIGVGLVLFVVGHIVGMILLGAAVWRIIPVCGQHRVDRLAAATPHRLRGSADPAARRARLGTDRTRLRRLRSRRGPHPGRRLGPRARQRLTKAPGPGVPGPGA